MNYKILHKLIGLILSIVFLLSFSVQPSVSIITTEGLSSYQPDTFFINKNQHYMRFLHDYDHGDTSGNVNYFIYEYPNKSWSKPEFFWGDLDYGIEITNFGFITYSMIGNVEISRYAYVEAQMGWGWNTTMPLMRTSDVVLLLDLTINVTHPEPILWEVRAIHHLTNGSYVILWDYLDGENEYAYHIFVTILNPNLTIVSHIEITEDPNIIYGTPDHPWSRSKDSYQIIPQQDQIFIYRENYAYRISSKNSWLEWENTNLTEVPHQKLFNNQFLFRIQDSIINIVDLRSNFLYETTITLPEPDFMHIDGIDVYIHESSIDITAGLINFSIFWLQSTGLALWKYSGTTQKWQNIATKNHDYNGSYFDEEKYLPKNSNSLFRVDLDFQNNTYFLYWEEQIVPFLSEIFTVTYSTDFNWSSISQITFTKDLPIDHFHSSEFSPILILLSPLALMVYASISGLLLLVLKFRKK